MLGMQKIKNEKIMTLEPGGIFGEEGICIAQQAKGLRDNQR